MNNKSNPQNILFEDETFHLNIFRISSQKMQIKLIVNIGIFTRIYSKEYEIDSLPHDAKWIFTDISGIFEYISEERDNKDKIIINPQLGQLQIKADISINNKKITHHSIILKLDRMLEEQLNQMRLQIKDDQDLRRSVEQMWRREEQNQKIFMKFKQQTEYKMEEISQRMNIQNTNISIMRQDISRITLYMDKLTKTLCPLLTKININSPYLQDFLLQDRKITFAGNSNWTQLILNHQLNGEEKFQFSFKILNCKKTNIIVGVTRVQSISLRSSLKKLKNMIGYSAGGLLYRRDGQQKIGEGLKSMHPLKMIIDIGNDRIAWKHGNKTIAETDLGELKGEQLSPYIQFCDPGDAIEIL